MLRRACAGAVLATAFTGLVVSSTPAPADAFSFLGGSLGLTQRDFRVFNNFTDASANNNTTPHPNFPGALGAELAIWKAHVEWGSVPYAGDGQGDGLASNPILGSGGANFDQSYQGLASSPGLTSDNIHSEIAGSGGSTLAFTVPPISSGWQIRYYSSWTWQDGPAGAFGGVDLQGVAAHEAGHALGLDHTNVFGATMFPSISGSGTGQRSLAADDIAGVQALYGTAAVDKTEITGLSGSTDLGEVLVIEGSDFGATDNEVWFSKLASDGTPSKVTGVPSTNGGTRIDVTIPPDAQDGEVLVRRPGNLGKDLSNPWPIDVTNGSGPAPTITGVAPSSGPQGGFTEVVVSGDDFGGTQAVSFAGAAAASFTVDSDEQITAVTAAGPLGGGDVVVTDAVGSDTLAGAWTYTSDPLPDVDTIEPAVGEEAGGTTVTISGASVVGTTSVTFGGVPGTGLTILDAQTLTVVTPPGTGTIDVVVTGNGSDTLVDGFFYQPPPGGAFVAYGTGLGGIVGVPALTGAGDLTPGGAGFTLTVTDAFPFAPVNLFVGLTSAALPFKGGTLATFPLVLNLPVGTTTLAGQLDLPGAIPDGTPATSLFLQAWITDSSGPQGLTATQGLEAQIP